MGGNEARERARREFLARLEADRARGEVQSRSQYQNLFPGFWDVVAEEYARAAASGSPSAPAAPTVPVLPRTEPPPSPTPREGPQRIGPYTVVRELGRGGMGVVYLAEDTRIRRRVALKVLPPQFASSETLLRRFRREAEAASRLDHPGLCPVYEADVDGLAPYIAMRFVEGSTLEERLRRARESGAGPPSGRDAIVAAVHLVERAARAIHAAHEAGLVHRDLKPGNLAVTPEGDPVVLDFGLARADGEDARTLTRTGTVMGTPAYMAPEQVLGEADRVDRRTDVYALGATLYECLTLRLPFEAAAVDALYRKVLESEPDDPRRVNPALPADLAVVVAKAMEKDPERRYASALEFAEDLRRVREWEPIRARPAGPITRTLRFVRRRQGLVAALAATALAAATVAWAAVRGDGGGPEATLAAAEELKVAGQTDAALLLLGRAFATAEEEAAGATAGAAKARRDRIAIAFSECLSSAAMDARLRGDLATTLSHLERARAVAKDVREVPAGTFLIGEADLDFFRMLHEVRQGRPEGAWEMFRKGLHEAATEGEEAVLERMLSQLRNPEHREHAEWVGILAVALCHPRGEIVSRWLGAQDAVVPSVFPGTIRMAAGAFPQPGVFDRFGANLEEAAAGAALRRGKEIASAFRSAILEGKHESRERDLAARILARVADLPPPPPERPRTPEDTAALALAVVDLDAEEGWRRRVAAAVEAADAGGGSAEEWLRARTGLRSPPPGGWGEWWRDAKGRPPREILAGALAPGMDASALDAPAVYGRMLASPEEERAAWHTLLGLVAPAGTRVPCWNPLDDAGRRAPAPDALYDSWAAALGDAIPPIEHRVEIVHMARGDWSEEPIEVWRSTLALRTGKPLTVTESAPLELPPIGPRSFLVTLAPQDQWMDLQGDVDDRYVFDATLRLRRTPRGAALGWTVHRFPGSRPHRGNARAEQGDFLVRSVPGFVRRDPCSFDMEELVLARIVPPGEEPLGGPGPGWEQAIGRSLGDRAREAEALPPEGAPGEHGPLRLLLERLTPTVDAACFLPLRGRTEPLRALEEALRPLEPRMPDEVRRARHGIALARLLAGDTAAVSGFPRPRPGTDAAAAAAWAWSTEGIRVQECARRLLLSGDPAIRDAARDFYSRSGVIWIKSGAATLLEEAMRRGRIPQSPELREAVELHRPPGNFVPPAGPVLAALLALLLPALVLLARPGAGLRERLRPAVGVLAAGQLLWFVRIYIPGEALPVGAAGSVLAAGAAWILAAAGAGWVRFLVPSLLGVAATAHVLAWFTDRQGTGHQLSELGWMAAFLACIAVPGLTAGLIRGASPRPLPRRFLGGRYGIQAVLFPVSLLGGVAIANWTGSDLLATISLVPWAVWIPGDLLRAASRRAGTPSLAARLRERLLGRPAA